MVWANRPCNPPTTHTRPVKPEAEREHRPPTLDRGILVNFTVYKLAVFTRVREQAKRYRLVLLQAPLNIYPRIPVKRPPFPDKLFFLKKSRQQGTLPGRRSGPAGLPTGAPCQGPTESLMADDLGWSRAVS